MVNVTRFTFSKKYPTDSMPGGWTALGLQPELLKAVQSLDWTLPTDVQDEAIPLMLGGGDVCVAAETGSGKTGAFGIPIVQAVFESRRKDLRIQSEQKVGKGKPKQIYTFNPNDRSSICRVSKDGLNLESQGVRAYVVVYLSYALTHTHTHTHTHTYTLTLTRLSLQQVGRS